MMLSDADKKALLERIQCNDPYLSSLEISTSGFCSENEIELLNNALLENNVVEKLRIDFWLLTIPCSKVFLTLTPFLQSNPTLKELNVGRVSMMHGYDSLRLSSDVSAAADPYGANSLLGAIIGSPALASLILTHVPFRDTALIESFLSGTTTLRKLHVFSDENEMPPAVCRAFGKGFLGNKSLEAVSLVLRSDLERVFFLDEVILGLQQHPAVQKLEIGGLREDNFATLRSLLQANSTIVEFEMGVASASDERREIDLGSIFLGLRYNDSIEKVRIIGQLKNQYDPYDFFRGDPSELESMLRFNTTITHFSFKGSNLTKELQSALAKGLLCNNYVKHVELSCDPYGPHGDVEDDDVDINEVNSNNDDLEIVAAWDDVLKFNKTLESLKFKTYRLSGGLASRWASRGDIGAVPLAEAVIAA